MDVVIIETLLVQSQNRNNYLLKVRKDRLLRLVRLYRPRVMMVMRVTINRYEKMYVYL